MREKSGRVVIRVEGLQKSFLKVRDFREFLCSIGWIAKIVGRIDRLKHLLECDEVLKDVSFEIRQGSVFGLFGVNGSGKTTLLNCMVNLLAPESGRILVYGKDVQEYGADLGRVFAKCNRYELYPFFTIMENVKFIARLRGLDIKEAMEAARAFLDLFELTSEEQEERLITRLSTGGRSKAALVCALLPLLCRREDSDTPPILLLDEPTLGFDVGSVEKFFEAIRSLRKTIPDLTVIIASNDPREADFCGDYVAIAKGRVLRKPKELEQVRRSVNSSRELTESLAKAIGQDLTNDEGMSAARNVPTRIAPAKRYSPFWAFSWRTLWDLRKHPELIALVVFSQVIPNLIGLFASAGTRGTWAAMVTALFGMYLTMTTRDASRLYDRERGWFHSLELILTSPVTRFQHFVATSVNSWLSEVIYTLISGGILFWLLHDRTAADLRQCAANMTLENLLGLFVVLTVSAIAARMLGLIVSLVPFITRPEQAHFLMMMVPMLLIVCGGVFYPTDCLPFGFRHIAAINPVTYASAALADFAGLGFETKTMFTEWLVEAVPQLSRKWANVAILSALCSVSLIFSAWFIPRAESKLRKLGKLRTAG